MAELAGVMVGNYFLLECLGREGMVETYRARPTTRGGYDVVLRIFRPQFPDPVEFHEHFASEVEKVWRCHHTHVQPLLEFGAGDGLLYSATLFSEEETLAQHLERQQDSILPIALVVRFVTQLCAALQYIHDHDIVHGNIQPSSVLLRDEDDILLTNFGMKHAYQEGEPMVAQVDEGNPAYTAPEQVVGMLSAASDIYAVGVLLFRLLGGCLPYDGESAGEIALKHANEPIPSLRNLRPELPEALELVVRVALAKTPAARFPSAAALAEALLAAVSPDAPKIISVPPQRRVNVTSRRTSFTWTRALSLLTLGLLLFGLGSTLFFISSLPRHIGDLISLPFQGGNQSGLVVSSTSPSSAPSTTTRRTVTTTNGGLLPTVVVGPGLPGRHPTPVEGQTPVPTVIGTVPTNPTVTPIGATPVPPICTPGSLSMDGSANLEPLLQQIDSDYQAQCAGMSIFLREDGSRPGIKLLQQGAVDVADSDLTANPALNLTDHPMAALLYAVIVNSDVQIGDVSSTNLQAIYRGQVTNWAQVGGPNEAITVILRPPSQAVAAIFRAFVLQGVSEHVAGIQIKKDDPNLVAQTVAQTPGAIAYVPLVVAEESNLPVVAIDGVFPSTQALLSGTYSFWSVEHLYTEGDGTAQAQAYIQFFSSPQEQNSHVTIWCGTRQRGFPGHPGISSARARSQLARGNPPYVLVPLTAAHSSGNLKSANTQGFSVNCIVLPH